MAKFYSCLRSPDDPTMDESLKEASYRVKVLEASDEGKKKSKFKAFKKLFGKKKKKEPADTQRERRLKSGVSVGTNISSLRLMQADEQIDPRMKRSLGNKSLSHDSIFVSESESERPASKTYRSPEIQRGRTRTLQKSRVFRSLPRAGSVYGAFSGSMLGAVPRYVPRSGFWVSGSKIIEIPQLRPRQPSLSMPLIESDTISKDFEEIPIDDESPKVPRKRSFSQKILSLKRGSFEPPAGPFNSSQSFTTFGMPTYSSSTQLPIAFSTPATTQDCLDSSGALHKMVLNPQKQMKKKTQATVKPKQEEPNFPLPSEEKSATRPKEADQEKPPKDSSGPSSQEQSNKTEIYDQTTDQAANSDAAVSQGNSWSQTHIRQHGKKGSNASGKSVCKPQRSSKQPSQKLNLGDRAESPPADKTARDSSFWHLSLKKQVMGQPIAPQAETSTPQESLSVKSDMRRRKADLNFEPRKASASDLISEDTKESMVGDPSPYHEDGASGAKKTEAKSSLLPVAKIPSTTQEDAMFSEAVEAQPFRDPSDTQSEKEDVSSFDMQSLQFKIDSAEDIPMICKEGSPDNVLQAFKASILGMASALTKGGNSSEKLPPRSPSQSSGKPEAEEITDAESLAVNNSGSEQELSPMFSFQSLGEPEDDQVVFIDSESFIGTLSSSLERVTPKRSPLNLREIEDEQSSESNSFVDDYISAGGWSSAEEDLFPRYPSPALGNPNKQQEVFSISRNTLEKWGVSVEPSFLRHPSPVLSNPKEQQEVSSISKNTLDEWGVSVEQSPPRHPSPVLSNPKEQQEVSYTSKNTLEEWGVSVEQSPPRHPSPALENPKEQQEVYSISKNTLEEWGVSMEQSPPRHPSPALENPKEQQEVYSISKNTLEWGVSVEQSPPRHPSPALGNPKEQQEVYSISKNTLDEWGVSVEQSPPRYPSQPFVGAFDQQVSLDSMSASEAWELMPPMHFIQPWVSPESKQQASADPESAAFDWAITLEPLPPRMTSRSPRKHKVEQPTSSDPEIATVKGITSMELQLPSHHPQSLVKPTAEQEIAADPESAAAEGSMSVEPPPPRHPLQPQRSPEVEQKVFSFPGSTAVEGGISMEPLSLKVLAQPLMNQQVEQNVSSSLEDAEKVLLVEPQFSPQCLTTPQAQHIFSENAAGDEDMFGELLPPNCPHQPLARLKFQPQTILYDSVSTSIEWSHPVEQKSPTYAFEPRMSPGFKQQNSTDSEGTAMEWGLSVEPLPPSMPSQPLMRPVSEQVVSPDSMSAPAESSSPVDPMPPNMPSQPLMRPVIEQPISAVPEGVVTEVDTSTELLPPRHGSIVRHKVQQMLTSVESATGERGISERPLPRKYSTYFLISSKIPEMSSGLEDTAVEGGTYKKLLLARRSSQSFVKFMAQKFFSESPAIEGKIYVDPPSSNQSSKSLLRPEGEQKVFSDGKSADTEGGISSKPLPTNCPLQSLGVPKDPQEIFSHSVSAPVKWSSSQEQLPCRNLSKALEKLKYQQEVASFSECSPKERQFQAENGSEFQPQNFSTGSVNVPVKLISAEDHLPPRHPFQASEDLAYQQKVDSSSMSAAAEGTSFESNPSSKFLPRDPASPNKTRKHSQGSEDLIKNVRTPATKFTIASSWPTSTSGDTYSKEEVLESSNQNNTHSNLPSSKADVENLFGVRLRRIPSSQKHKSEKQDDFTKRPAFPLRTTSSLLGREPQIRSASQEFLDTTENLTTRSDFSEKQQGRPKSDSMIQFQPAYKIPGKTPDQPSDFAISEPAWVTMVKQRQKNFLAHIPMKAVETKTRAEAKAESMKPKYERAENQLEEMFTSNVNTQVKMAQMKLPKSTKAEFENQKIFQVPATTKDTRESSALPAVLQEPNEPVWFSMAKKKAKAWRSHVKDN